MRLQPFLLCFFTFFGLLLVNFQTSKSDTNAQIAQARPPCYCPDTLALHPLAATDVAQEIGAAQKAEAINAIFERRYQNGVFNGAVLVAQEGVIIYNKAFGKQDFESMADNNVFSKFQLASVSKTFTAAAILMLYEQKKLDLNDVVQKYFADFPYSGVLIKDLLSHRSGIPNYIYAFNDSVRPNRPRPTNADVMRWLGSVQPRADRLPDTHFAYNNSNYMVLAAIVEKISGLPFDVFLRKNIFLPLGMYNSFVATTQNDSINRNRTFGYTGSKQIPTDYWDNVAGDKGVYSTTNDMYIWYKALNSNCLLKKETLVMAFEPRSFEQNGTRNYGYGFRLKSQANGEKFIYHNGWWKGYNACFGFSPEQKYVVIILNNRLSRNVYDINPIINILTGTTQNATETNPQNPEYPIEMSEGLGMD